MPSQGHLTSVLSAPHLQREWHCDNNALLGGKVVKPKSGFRAKWQCNNCPAGKPHIFFTSVQKRTNGTKCPYYEGRRACMHKFASHNSTDGCQVLEPRQERQHLKLLPAAITKQSGGILTAGLNARPVFKSVSETMVVVPSVVRHANSRNRSSLQLRQRSTSFSSHGNH